MELYLAIAFSITFALTNGFHDAANAVATLVATRGASPAQAVGLSAVFNMLGALIVGTAVADTIAGIVTVPADTAVAVIGSGALAATLWNVLTWAKGLPSSSAHALVGGLVGAALLEGGTGAVHWGGMDGLHPVGVLGVAIVLAVSPVLGFGFGYFFLRACQRLLRRASRRISGPIRSAEWVMSAGLSFGHGANDGQKAMGVIAALLLASGHTASLTVPIWVKIACGAALTLGTAMGGWRIVRTIGRRIFPLSRLDGLASQTSSTAVILGSSFTGAPVSTTQVVASSVVGVGGGRRRWHHVRWLVVREIAAAWILTPPGAAALGAVTLLIWRLA